MNTKGPLGLTFPPESVFEFFFPGCVAETDTDESPPAPLSSAAVDADLLNQRQREHEGTFAAVVSRLNLL